MVTLYQWVRLDMGARRDGAVAMRIVHATSLRIESQAVIGALPGIVDDLTAGQGRGTMRTTIGKGYRAAILKPVQRNRFVEHFDARRSWRKLFAPASDIPGIAQECHCCFPGFRQSLWIE